MMKSLDIDTKKKAVNLLFELQRILQNVEVKRECKSCENFNAGICQIAKKEPPEEIKQNGCEHWREIDFIPF